MHAQRPPRRLPQSAARSATGLVVAASILSGCASTPSVSKPEPVAPRIAEPAPHQDPAEELAAAFPHIRIDRASGVVEFDGAVPIDAHDERAPRVYLELVACTPDTREHEVLVVTNARPSHIHAALLLLGLEPGRPASWTFTDDTVVRHEPTGPRVTVELVTTDDQGRPRVDPASRWIRHARTGEHFPAGPWLFSGSVFVRRQGEERYDADFSGTLIGLTTFGTEVLSWRDVISPDSMIDEPVWIADAAHVPPAGTAVTVRLRPVRESGAR